ncbi:MAG: hypothetical protein ACI4QM_03505, partial [Alphaproteobacteria bacterium]
GYIWVQSTVGYYDHHVFHFTLLMWVVALIARSFVRSHQRDLLITAGALTALGTWITAEFFINSYIVLVPFVYLWLVKNHSLKPAVIYSAAYTFFLALAMSFDHPMAGFWTLDFYRASLFHVILGAMNTLALGALVLFFKAVSPSFSRRLIYMALVGSIYASVLLVCFRDILLVPMADPRLYHIWVSKVTEMAPAYNSTEILHGVIIPIVTAILMIVWILKRQIRLLMPMVLLCGTGLLFYAVVFLFHVRVGISTNVFFVLLMSLYFNMVFFPREKGFRQTFCFVLLYCLFIGSALKGHMIAQRIYDLSVQRQRALFNNNSDADIPEWLKLQLQAEQNQNAEDEKPQDTFSCVISKEAITHLKEAPVDGGVFTDIFDAPQILWETKRPIVSGPYHTNVSGSMDVFYTLIDRPPFSVARRILTERHLTQVYVKSPYCFRYVFYDEETKKLNEKNEDAFYRVLYDQKQIPTWLELTYHNKKTGEKIYRVKEGLK